MQWFCRKSMNNASHIFVPQLIALNQTFSLPCTPVWIFTLIHEYGKLIVYFLLILRFIFY
jgi:hypothetical protein